MAFSVVAVVSDDDAVHDSFAAYLQNSCRMVIEILDRRLFAVVFLQDYANQMSSHYHSCDIDTLYECLEMTFFVVAKVVDTVLL